MSDITVYAVGGVTREYREEQRQACVGELVKKTGGIAFDRKNGSIWTVVNDNHLWPSGCRDGTGVTLNDGEPIFHFNYAVLIPTNIVHYDGKRCREVERMAKVGERIVIVAPKDTCGDYGHGDVFTVSSVERDGVDVVQPDHSKLSWMFHEEYSVLEPIDVTSPSPAPSDADRIATLERRMSELTLKVDRLEGKQWLDNLEKAYGDIFIDGSPSPVQIDPLIADLYKPNTPPAYTREQVVDMAKRDVEELLRTDIVNVPMLDAPIVKIGYRPNGYEDGGRDVVEFIDDRKRGKVIALIRLEKYGELNRVWARGIAKCETDECFNISIGRAISLRRALGLDVPDIYTNAPKPTEAQVGDIVEKTFRNMKYVTKAVNGDSLYDFYGPLSDTNHDPKLWRDCTIHNLTIVDDSHDFGQEAKS